MNKRRVNWSISQEAIKILKQIKRVSGKSYSRLVEEAITKTYGDKLELLQEEKRKLAKRMNQLDRLITDQEGK